MTALVDHLTSLPAWLLLLVAGTLVFLEDAAFVGFVLPAEAVAVLAGVSASLGHLSLPVVMVVVVVAAIVGDSVGYEVGKHFGPRLIAWHRLDGHREAIERGQALIARRGGIAVLLGRFTAFLRAVTPALAGMSRMPYRTFLPWNAAGGLVWGVGVVLIGYVAGASYAAVEKTVGRAAGGVVLVVVVLAAIAWFVRRRMVREDTP